MKKRALSAILALVLMAFAVIPGTVFADEDYTPDMSTPPKITRVEIIQNGSSYGIQVKIKTPTSVKNLMEMLEFFSMEHYISGICASVSLEGNAWQEMDLSYTDEGEKWSGFWASESISGLTASSWVQVRVCYTGTDKEGNPVISDWSGITALNGAADGPKEETEESFDFNAHDWAKAELTEADGAGLIPESLRAADLTQPITRAEFAAVSVRVYETLSGLTAEPAAVSPFTDTADAEVLKALNVGITNGLSAATFGPAELLSREQAATMLTRVYKKVAFESWTLDTDGDYAEAFRALFTMPEPFADDGDISAWARDSVYFMAANGVLNGVGDNRFAPKLVVSGEETLNHATREQAILIAVRLVKNLSA